MFKIKEYNSLIDESLATHTAIGNNLIEVSEVISVDGNKVTISKIVDKKTMEPIDTVQTVTYHKKVGGKDVVVSYKTDNLTGQRVSDYEISYMADSCTKVTYTVNDKKEIVKNKEGNIAYNITYDYVDDFGNKASATVEIIFDDIPPKVEILEPGPMEHFNTNAIPVKWTVNGETQDTLTLQRLEKGFNYIIRRYVDKAGNVAADTVTVLMNEAKDIDIEIINPVTKVDQDKVDEYYSEGHKYNDKKPFDVKFVDPKNDTIPDVIGVGFKVDIVLPSVSPTGSLATLDDIVKNGQIPVDDKGNIVGASTHGIPVDQYVEEHCTEEFQKDYDKYGLNIPLYDVTYKLHLWVYTTTANYVNDFKKFLKEISNQEFNFVEPQVNDKALICKYGNGTILFDLIASTGTQSLRLLYYWHKKMDKTTFVFIDEFDAFYHFSLSLRVCKLLFGIKCQVFLSSHNTYLMTNDLLRPDCNFILQNNKIKPLQACTEKELRFGHNIEKIYKAGAFHVE